jgi:hypothetical protein
MQVPSQTELERFFDAERAPAVQFVETVGSWPSLRVLDFLFQNEPASTGDIARGLNMDMRDVKDRLDALADQGVVEESPDGWSTTTDQITISLARQQGVDISYTTAGDEQPVGDSAGADETVESDEAGETEASTSESDQTTEETDSSGGLVARLRRAVGSLFD